MSNIGTQLYVWFVNDTRRGSHGFVQPLRVKDEDAQGQEKQWPAQSHQAMSSVGSATITQVITPSLVPFVMKPVWTRFPVPGIHPQLLASPYLCLLPLWSHQNLELTGLKRWYDALHLLCRISPKHQATVGLGQAHDPLPLPGVVPWYFSTGWKKWTKKLRGFPSTLIICSFLKHDIIF